MSLFVINRYLGDEDDGGGSNKESRSKALLAKLQQKAKEKEKRMSTSHKEQQPEVQTDHKEKQRPPKFQTDNKEHHLEIPTDHKEHKSKAQTHTQDVKKKRKVEKDHKQESKHSKKSKGEETVIVPLSASDHEKTVEEEKAVLEKTDIPVTGQDEQVKVAEEEEEDEREDEEEEDEEEEEEEEEDEEEGEEEKKEEKKEMQVDQLEQGTETAPTQTTFTILGGFKKKPVQKVHRVLPQWLAQPDRIQRDITSNLVPISEVQGICDRLTKNLESNGIQHLFPVQAEVIPAILESVHQGLLVGRGGYKPRDICVSAPTGSGKTLAFVIPVIQALMQRVVCEVRVLAVLPTKELAQQVCKVFNSYAEGTGLKVVMLAGQKSFAVEQSLLTESRGGRRCSLADIVVATPGRLVDHLNENSDFCLEHLRFLIIDEADRMIDSMHQSWLSQVIKAVYRSGSGNKATSIFTRTELTHITAASLSPPQMPLQKLLFSATLTHDPEKLQQLGLHQPRLFSSVHGQLADHTTGSQPGTPESTSKKPERFNFPQGLTELYVPCTLSKKPLLILHFVLHMKFSPILCFTNSREAAHRLYLLVHLFGGVQVAEFSSRLSTGERKRTLKDLEQGKIQMLISTDAAARGIDVKGVKYVVNYDAPQYIRTYVHRVGRTARAGKAGLAFTFLLKPQEKNFLQMVRDAGSPGIERQTVKAESLKSMEAHYEQTLQELARAIKEEKAS